MSGPPARKIKVTATDLDDVLSHMQAEFGLAGDEFGELALAFEATPAVRVTELSALPDKAKVQLWPASKFTASSGGVAKPAGPSPPAAAAVATSTNVPSAPAAVAPPAVHHAAAGTAPAAEEKVPSLAVWPDRLAWEAAWSGGGSGGGSGSGGGGGQRLRQTLNIRNSGGRTVCFKLKTTHVERYAVRPKAGVLHAGASVEIEVVLLDANPAGGGGGGGGSLQDRFLIQAAFPRDVGAVRARQARGRCGAVPLSAFLPTLTRLHSTL
eukprot:SAG22_NODE_1215_length_5146_cov_1.556965_2_plen_267_part_00